MAIFYQKNKIFILTVDKALWYTRIIYFNQAVHTFYQTIFMPPTLKKLRRHIGLGLLICPSICLVRPSVTLALGQEQLEIGS